MALANDQAHGTASCRNGDRGELLQWSAGRSRSAVRGGDDRRCAILRGAPFRFASLTIFIGNLSWDTEREDLTHLFGQYGEVTKCSLPLDRESGRKRGFGFVDLANEQDETNAINDLQDVEWMGRNITVRKAEPRR